MQSEQLNAIINDLNGQLSQRSLELAVARSEIKMLNNKLEQQKKAADVQQETEVIVKHTDQ